MTAAVLTRRVDHIMIRAVSSTYDHLFSFLTQELQLPLSWPVNDMAPGFKTGGVFAGNINLEIFQSGTQQRLPSPDPSLAQLYGIAFEPYTLLTAVQEVKRRNLAHLPLIPVPEGYPAGTMGSMWTLLFFGNLLGCDLSQYQNVMKEAQDLSPFFTKLFQNGMAFLCEYNKSFTDITQERVNKHVELQAKHGGPLGLAGTQEIVIGAKNIDIAQRHWQSLFDPIPSINSGLWHLGDGPTIRLISYTQDGLVRLVWKVASLQNARAFLREQGISYVEHHKRIAVTPAALFGLDIHLVE